MACGVNSRPRNPSGPDRDSNRYMPSRTTTGGSPMKALSTTTMIARPGNRTNANSAPSGRPTADASSVAETLTVNDSLMIAYSAGSPPRMRSNAEAPSCMLFIINCCIRFNLVERFDQLRMACLIPVKGLTLALR
jgi:hypothetical protein